MNGARTKKRLVPLIGAVALLAFAGLVVFYLLGYRFGPGVSIIRTGSIVVEVPKAGTKVYLDTKKRKTTTQPREEVRFSYLSPEDHLVIAAKDGYYPWTKALKVRESKVSRLRPFLVPSNPSGFIITGEDPEYEKILSLTSGNALPSRLTKKTSADGKMAVWFENGGIRAEWLGAEENIPGEFCSGDTCDREIEAVTLSQNPRNIDFYPGRNDVLIIAGGENIFAVDIDRHGLQNFQPVYKGATPWFGLGAGTLFVRDGGVLMEIKL